MNSSSARRGARGPAGVPTPHLAPNLKTKERRKEGQGPKQGGAGWVGGSGLGPHLWQAPDVLTGTKK